MELRDHWNAVRRRWYLLLASVLVTVGAASLITVQATSQYSSQAQLFVSTTQDDSSDAYQGGLFASQRVASYADIVQSMDLAERVSESLGGTPSAEQLVQKVESQVTPDTVLLTITATDPDPELARDIAQTYAKEMVGTVRQLETPAKGSDGPPIKATIIDRARVPDDPVSPQPLRNLGLGLVLGLLLGLGLAVLRELTDTSLKSAMDVGEVTEAPVIGTIPLDSKAAVTEPADTLASMSHWSEAYRVLRTNLQYLQVDQPGKVMVVSSSMPGEGKTTTAINLAVTLAMAGHRVALVECDLRRPLVAERLGLTGQVGTTTALLAQVTLSEALQTYEDTGLEVLTSGRIPPNPSELLQSHAMEELLGELRARFDVVLVDAPPLLPVTDAALLAAQTDGALVVARHGKSTRDHLDHAAKRLEAVEARLLGVVMNMAPTKTWGGGYGYGYGYAPDRPEAATAEERPQRGRATPGRRRRGTRTAGS